MKEGIRRVRAGTAASLVAVVALIGPMPAGAEEDSEAPGVLADEDPESLGVLGDDFDLDDFLLDDEFALLAEEDFVVSAVRHVQRIEHSPSAVTVITREEILASGYDNVADLMRLVPGADVFRVSQAHVGVGFRTSTSPGGDIIRVLLDGRDTATHLLGSPLWMGLPADVESIERIEVIRGPGSTLYGSQALQGVVNIVTRKASEEPFTAEGRVSGAGMTTRQIDLRAHGTQGRLGYWTSFGHDSRAPQDDPFADPKESWRARARLDWRPTDEIDTLLELGYVQIGGSALSAVGHGWFSAHWPYLLAKLSIGATEVQLVAEETRALLDIDFAFTIPETEDRAAIPLGSVPPIHHDTRSVELLAQHAIEPFKGNRLTAGASARVIHHLPRTMITCEPMERRDFDPALCHPTELYETRLGAFVQDEWQVHDEITLTGGLRIDRSSLNPDPGISPRLAAIWSPHPHHALRASFGRAYRYPLFVESHGHVLMEPHEDAPPDIARAVQHLFAVGGGNPDLGNQTVDSVEAGWRGRFLEGRFVATVDLFALSLRGRYYLDGLDDIELVTGLGGLPTLSDALPLYANRTDPMVAVGGEATAMWRPTSRLRLSGSYALDHRVLEDTDDTDVRRLSEPRHRLVGSSRFDLVDGLSAGVDVHWSSRFSSRSQDPASLLLAPLEEDLGGQPIVLGSLRYRRPLGDRSLEVGLSAFNLLDMDTREQAGAETLGRRLRIFVSVRP